MGRCCFSGKHDLKSHGNRPAARLQTDIAPERVGAYPHHVRRFHERRINVCPAPELRFHAVGIVSELPISAHAQIGELAIQFLESLRDLSLSYSWLCSFVEWMNTLNSAASKPMSESIIFVHGSASGFEREQTLIRSGFPTATHDLIRSD